MQKTTLGISVGLLGAITYFSGLFSGLLLTSIITAYILLKEDNEWLKKSAVKAVVLSITFSALAALINLVPGAIGVVTSTLGIIGINLYFSFITSIFSTVVSIITLLEKVLFLILGLKALNQGTFTVPVVDDIIDKHFTK